MQHQGGIKETGIRIKIEDQEGELKSKIKSKSKCMKRGKEVVTVKNTPEIGIIHIVVMIESQRGQKHQVDFIRSKCKPT